LHKDKERLCNLLTKEAEFKARVSNNQLTQEEKEEAVNL